MNNINFDNEFNNEDCEVEAFFNAASQIVDLYSKDPDVKKMEAMVRFYVLDTGRDTKALHVYFLFCIRGAVERIAAQKGMLLACPVKYFGQKYPGYCAIDTISETIYDLRKKSLGLVSYNATYKDFSVDILSQMFPVGLDRKAISKSMKKLENRVVKSLDYNMLRSEEMIYFPWGPAVDTFAFHKILDEVIKYSCDVDDEVKGLTLWAAISSFYEIATKIYNNYYKKEKEN